MSAVRPTAPARASISVRGVTKRFEIPREPSFLALQEASLEVSPGEFLALVGPSGCGKSTLLRLMSGLIPPSEGEIWVGDTRVEGPQADFSTVFQSPRLLPWKTVEENVALPLRLGRRRATPAKREVRDRVAELLDLVQLSAFARRYPGELSGGMQQRVSIARSLVTSASILLMDEPFGALDAFTREYLNEELLSIWKATGRTIVFVTHDMDEAVFLADRVAVMGAQPGRIIDVVDIDLPRERDGGIRTDAAFFDAVRTVRQAMGSTGRRADPAPAGAAESTEGVHA